MTTLTATAAEARSNFSRIADAVSSTRQQVTIFRNSKPWVIISPAADESADYIELARSGILEGRKAIDAGEGIEGTSALRSAIKKERAHHG